MTTYNKVFYFTCLLIFCTQNISICKNDEFQEYKIASLKFKIASVPNILVARMDSFIIAKTGKIIFEKYFDFDTVYSGYYLSHSSNPKYGDSINYFWDYPHYYFVYNFRIPEKPWHKLCLGWPTDTLGNFNKNHLPYGIPDCSSDSSRFFLIDSSQAISIAQSFALKECINMPTAKLKIYLEPVNTSRDTLETYKEHFIWEVNCQIVKSKKGEDYLGILIDVNDGKMLHEDTTKIRYNTL